MVEMIRKFQVKTQGDIPAPPTLEFIDWAKNQMKELEVKFTRVEGKVDTIHTEVSSVKDAVKELTQTMREQNSSFECFAREEHSKIYDRINSANKEIDDNIESKADGEDFKFWKWIIVVGIFLSVFSIFVSLVIDKYFSK